MQDKVATVGIQCYPMPAQGLENYGGLCHKGHP